MGPSTSWNLWPRPVARAVVEGRGSVHRSEKMGSRRRFGAFVYTVASRGSRERTVGGAGVYTDWRKWPLDAVSGHLCTLLRRGVARAAVGGAGVYTDWRKWPLGAVLGHLCTLLRRPVVSGGASGRWGAQECTQIGENGLSAPFWGICVHCCDAICVHCCDARLRRVARAAPSRGRRLHRGVNPHKPRWI